jgi:cell filamentation protein
MTSTKYDAHGKQAEFEPNSGGRVLRNLQGIVRVSDMEMAESQALLDVQDWALSRFAASHRFTAADVCDLHKHWLSSIYPWAGAYRNVHIGKGGFMFAAAGQIPRLMAEFETKILSAHTPCKNMNTNDLARALAITHAELIIIHPFREGNGRCARLLALLMAMQSGLPTLDFSPLSGRHLESYILSIQAAFRGDYAPLTIRFLEVLRRTAKRT